MRQFVISILVKILKIRHVRKPLLTNLKQLLDFQWQKVIIYSSKISVGRTSFLSIPFCVKPIWWIFTALKFGCSIPDRIFWTSLKIIKTSPYFSVKSSVRQFYSHRYKQCLTFVLTFIVEYLNCNVF